MKFINFKKTTYLPQTQKQSAGFSILEVLITAAIIGIITAIITLKYGSFNNLILLKNQAYQVAIDLRETQVRALSAVSVSGGSEFRSPYGIYFNRNTPDRYVLFHDLNNNGFYTAGEELETIRLDSRFGISRLCSGNNCSLSNLHVTFRRPNFDAIINNGSVSNGTIELTTVVGSSNTRTININAAGQIMVE